MFGMSESLGLSFPLPSWQRRGRLVDCRTLHSQEVWQCFRLMQLLISKEDTHGIIFNPSNPSLSSHAYNRHYVLPNPNVGSSTAMSENKSLVNPYTMTLVNPNVISYVSFMSSRDRKYIHGQTNHIYFAITIFCCLILLLWFTAKSKHWLE